MKKLMLTTTAAILAAGAASAQMFTGYGSDLDLDTFNSGFAESGYYDALDTNRDTMLDRSEFATGLYADYDRNADSLVDADEYRMGTERYFGADAYDEDRIATYDLDGDGMLNQQEFGTYYGENDFLGYDEYDMDGDGMLNNAEYSEGLYGRADLNRNQVIEIEEEGFFEGWFDGDDIEAEITSVGEVYSDL
jgi:hypothetical protein